MNMKKILKLRIMVALCLVLALACSQAYADHRGGGGSRGFEGRGGGNSHGDRHVYHYREDGRWYRNGFLWFDTAVTFLAIGALVDRLPPKRATVVYAGVPYYYADGYYYRVYDQGGYVVVQPPIVTQTIVTQPVVAQPVVVTQQVPATTVAATTVMPTQNVQASAATTTAVQNTASADTVTLNIPNSKGGYTPVILTKAGTGYIGPQGEYYAENPTVAQLQTLYSGM
jgi:hypothetical protein